MKHLSDSGLRRYGASLSTFTKISLLAVAAVVAMSFAAPAFAQTVSFNIDAVYDAPNVIPRLQWSTTPAASSCTASGDPAWTGTKAASGSVSLPAVLPPRVYTLACSFPGDTTAVVTWAPPTQNVDGSALTDLARFRVRWGLDPSNLIESRLVNGATSTTTTITNLAAGNWSFGVHAQNTLGLEGPISTPLVTKTTSAAIEVTQSVGVHVPGAPTGVGVE